MASNENKKLTEELKLRLAEDLFLDLSRLADAGDRSLSDYVRHVLSSHVYGAARTVRVERADG